MTRTQSGAEVEYLVRLLGEGVHKYPQQFIRIVDLVSILANDPNEGRFRFRLIQLFQICAECGDYSFVCGGVLPEDILNDVLL